MADRDMKRCSPSSIIEEMPIRTSHPLGQPPSKKQKTGVGEDVEEREPRVLSAGLPRGVAAAEDSVAAPQQITNRFAISSG